MTAVEFIVDELNKEMGLISFVTGTEESYKSAIFSIIEQAKEIEKKIIAQAFEDGDYNYFYSTKTDKEFDNGLEYYNEKFKSE